jgi:hypothetical protein
MEEFADACIINLKAIRVDEYITRAHATHFSMSCLFYYSFFFNFGHVCATCMNSYVSPDTSNFPLRIVPIQYVCIVIPIEVAAPSVCINVHYIRYASMRVDSD